MLRCGGTRNLKHADLYQSGRSVRGSAIEAKEKTKLLRAVGLLEPLSHREVEELGRRLPDLRFERGQYVYTPVFSGKLFFLLLRGRIRTYKVVGGQDSTLVVAGAGEVFGEAAFTSRKRWGAYAEVMEPSDVAVVSLGAYERLVREKPEVGLKAMELLGERLAFYESRLVDISLKEVPARLASLLLYLVQSETYDEGYEITYTHEQLGAMIGAKRVAVTRALGELRRAGAVEPRGRRLYIRDSEILERLGGGENRW